jgi:hypothetical protein
MILWPIDPILSFMTAGAFLVLFCDFLLAAIDGDPA